MPGPVTLAPGAMPRRGARPPTISSTAATGSPDGIGVSENGTAFSAMRATVPSARMKTMSSGVGVFFIQKLAACGAPPAGG